MPGSDGIGIRCQAVEHVTTSPPTLSRVAAMAADLQADHPSPEGLERADPKLDVWLTLLSSVPGPRTTLSGDRVHVARSVTLVGNSMMIMDFSSPQAVGGPSPAIASTFSRSGSGSWSTPPPGTI